MFAQHPRISRKVTILQTFISRCGNTYPPDTLVKIRITLQDQVEKLGKKLGNVKNLTLNWKGKKAAEAWHKYLVEHGLSLERYSPLDPHDPVVIRLQNDLEAQRDSVKGGIRLLEGAFSLSHSSPATIDQRIVDQRIAKHQTCCQLRNEWKAMINSGGEVRHCFDSLPAVDRERALRVLRQLCTVDAGLEEENHVLALRTYRVVNNLLIFCLASVY